ncbi:hypothetical protein MMF93_26525 [Streptomyces tubbatahanensis]|uniref:Uncharacterized protein n=1 Tax=Streptomyces tubbatahanensis TaxID=2923272 RepID=A0ABY3XZ25_9ACTN|nr:hypothetical protein [Streptomyces tubbatahanensis]UNS99606.1 hypothetical protein MMF93_26525 [Streptomyces tubbatahanensis]
MAGRRTPVQAKAARQRTGVAAPPREVFVEAVSWDAGIARLAIWPPIETPPTTA